MNVIKECKETTAQYKGQPSRSWTTCFLRADHSDISLATLHTLFNEAVKDFPGLQEKDVLLSRSKPLAGTSAAIAANPGLVSYDSIQFRAPSAAFI